jgi:hypothetical protein
MRSQFGGLNFSSGLYNQSRPQAINADRDFHSLLRHGHHHARGRSESVH